MTTTSASPGRPLQRLQMLLLAVALCATCAVLDVRMAHAARDLRSTEGATVNGADLQQTSATRDIPDVCNTSDLKGLNASAYTTQCTTNCRVCEAGGKRRERRCVCCKAGYQVSLTSNASCAACPIGFNKAEPGTSRCTSCIKLGMTTTAVGSTACNACLPGRYFNLTFTTDPAAGVPITAAPSCLECPVGSFSTGGPFFATNNTGPVCSPCPGDSTTATFGSERCSYCKPGHTGPLPCTACPIGTWSPGGPADSTINCTACPAGSSTRHRSSSSPGMCEAIPCRPSCNSTGNVPIGGQCGAVSDGCGGVCTNTCAGAGAARRVGKKIAGLPLQCQDGTCVAVKCTPTCTSNLEVEPFGGCGPAVKDGCGGVCELKCSSKSQCMFGTQSYVDVGVCVPFPEPTTCYPVGLPPPIQHGAWNDTCIFTPIGQNCTATCPDKYQPGDNGPPTSACTVHPVRGLIWSEPAGSCELATAACAKNPCAGVLGASGCVDLANGAYYCTCGTGYQAVGPYPNTCKDIDGCRGNAGTASDPCNSITLAVAGSCVDIKAPGTGFSCACPAYTIWNGAACTVNCPTFGRASPLPKDSSFSFNVCPPGKVIAGSVVRTGGIWDGVRLTCSSQLSAGVTGGTDIIVGGTGGMDQTQITTTTGFIKARLTTAVFSGTGTTMLGMELFDTLPLPGVSKGYQKGDITEGGTTTTGSTSATQECPAGQIMVGACCDAGIYMYRFGIVCAPFP